MRKWIGIMMMVVLAVTTAMPAMSHAAMKHEHHEQAAAHDDGDCDHRSHKASATHHDKHEKPCCDKGICKCVGGSCHNGLAKMFGSTDASLLSLASSQSQFSFAEENIESALTERLQRPPKA